MDTIRERVQWTTVAASGAAALSVLAISTFGGVGTPGAPSAYRLVAVAALVFYGIWGLHHRTFAQAVIGPLISLVLAVGHPILVLSITGVVAAGIVAATTHWQGGTQKTALGLAALVYVLCFTTGATWSRRASAPLLIQTTTQGTPPDVPTPKSQELGVQTGARAPKAASAPARLIDVSFRSTPAGAAIYVDKEHVGSTPCQKSLLLGTHEARFERAGYETERTTFRVSAGRPALVEVTMRVTPLRRILGVWQGEFDSKPLRLEVAHVASDGTVTASGAIAFRSGTRERALELSGRYDPGSHTIQLRESETGIVLTGSLNEREAYSEISGVAQTPGTDGVRRWSVRRKSDIKPSG